jgi:hypothetical protein
MRLAFFFTGRNIQEAQLIHFQLIENTARIDGITDIAIFAKLHSFHKTFIPE